MIVMDNISTKKTNVIATNITSTASINCYSKENKRLLYFPYRFISDHITIDNYYNLLSLCKTRKHNITMKKNEIKKVCVKNSTCYYLPLEKLLTLHNVISQKWLLL